VRIEGQFRPNGAPDRGPPEASEIEPSVRPACDPNANFIEAGSAERDRGKLAPQLECMWLSCSWETLRSCRVVFSSTVVGLLSNDQRLQELDLVRSTNRRGPFARHSSPPLGQRFEVFADAQRVVHEISAIATVTIVVELREFR